MVTLRGDHPAAAKGGETQYEFVITNSADAQALRKLSMGQQEASA